MEHSYPNRTLRTVFICLLSATWLLSCNSHGPTDTTDSPEQAVATNKSLEKSKAGARGGIMYQQTMNDSIALSTIFKSVVPDADFLAEHQVRVLAGVWKAPNADSVKARYPEAYIDDNGNRVFNINYTIDNTLKNDTLYNIDYSAHLTGSDKAKFKLGFNTGVATFKKTKEGWYLKSNTYNTEISDKSKPVMTPDLTYSQLVTIANSDMRQNDDYLKNIGYMNDDALSNNESKAGKRVVSYTFVSGNQGFADLAMVEAAYTGINDDAKFVRYAFKNRDAIVNILKDMAAAGMRKTDAQDTGLGERETLVGAKHTAHVLIYSLKHSTIKPTYVIYLIQNSYLPLFTFLSRDKPLVQP